MGVQAERQANYDAAYAYYKQAYTLTPGNPKYFAAYTRMRFNAATQHVHAGQLLRNTGALTEALAEFQHAVEIDGSSFLAQQELRRTADMIRRQERQRAAPKAEPPRQAGRRGRRVGGTAAALERSHHLAHDRECGRSLQDHLQTGGAQRDHRSGLQAAEDQGRSHRCDAARGVGHGSPPVEDFLASGVCRTPFLWPRIRRANARSWNRTS